MSIFEIGMLVCFGSAWPLSIYKSYTSRSNEGKSHRFLWVIFVGYLLGSVHKLRNDYDPVFYLYIFNAIMVAIDIGIYYVNKHYPPPADRRPSE